ncbi:MAG: alpha/beta hydrolase [Gluconacetobacter diazotrophicus]|nr:alpha/beta hydrolase [Gluconacetobacter diazotrophicus]
MKPIIAHPAVGAAGFGNLSGPEKAGLWGVGLGASLGAFVAVVAVLALRWFVRPPTKERIPETISPQRFATRAFQTSRGQMFYHEGGAGAGPALVFIHNVGVGASAYQWSKVYPAFADNHRVIAVDLLGFGESERPLAKLTAHDYAESLAEFVGGVCGDDPQRPVIIARGLGAGFVALMAAEHPDLAARLLLWMPSGRANVPLWLNLASRVPNLKRYVYRNKLARRATIRARFEAPGAFVDPGAVTQESVDMHAICAQQDQADYAIYRLFQGKMSFDLDARFRNLAVPTTLLWPARLAGGPGFAAVERLAGANGLCTLRVVPDAGPYAPLEAPGSMIGVLDAELRGEPQTVG